MSKKLADVINNIEKQMESYIQHKADINSFGKVVAIGDGVARVFGLADVQAGKQMFSINLQINILQHTFIEIVDKLIICGIPIRLKLFYAVSPNYF